MDPHPAAAKCREPAEQAYFEREVAPHLGPATLLVPMYDPWVPTLAAPMVFQRTHAFDPAAAGSSRPTADPASIRGGTPSNPMTTGAAQDWDGVAPQGVLAGPGTITVIAGLTFAISDEPKTSPWWPRTC